eukprot:gene7906-6903_t
MSSVSHKCTRKWAGLTPEKQKEVVDAAVAMSSATIIKPVKSGKRKRVQKTFTGEDAANWLISTRRAKGRKSAIAFGELLLAGNLIRDLDNTGTFQTGKRLFGFVAEDELRDPAKVSPSVRTLVFNAMLSKRELVEGWLTLKISSVSGNGSTSNSKTKTKTRFVNLHSCKFNVAHHQTKLPKHHSSSSSSSKKKKKKMRQQHKEKPQDTFTIKASSVGNQAIEITATAPTGGEMERWVAGFVHAGAEYTEQIEPQIRNAPDIYGFTAFDAAAKPVSFDAFRGKTVLITTVAPTDPQAPLQFAQLRELQAKFHSAGLRVVVFPSNQLSSAAAAAAAAGTNGQMKQSSIALLPLDMAGIQNATTAPTAKEALVIMATANVNGCGCLRLAVPPLLGYLKSSLQGSRGDYMQHTFEKYLVSHEGKPIKRIGADVAPRRLEPELREMLGISAAALLNVRRRRVPAGGGGAETRFRTAAAAAAAEDASEDAAALLNTSLRMQAAALTPSKAALSLSSSAAATSAATAASGATITPTRPTSAAGSGGGSAACNSGQPPRLRSPKGEAVSPSKFSMLKLGRGTSVPANMLSSPGGLLTPKTKALLLKSKTVASGIGLVGVVATFDPNVPPVTTPSKWRPPVHTPLTPQTGGKHGAAAAAAAAAHRGAPPSYPGKNASVAASALPATISGSTSASSFMTPNTKQPLTPSFTAATGSGSAITTSTPPAMAAIVSTPNRAVASAVVEAAALSAFASFRKLEVSKGKSLASLEFLTDIGWCIHEDEQASSSPEQSPPRQVLTPLSQNLTTQSPAFRRTGIPPWAKKYVDFDGGGVGAVGGTGGGDSANGLLLLKQPPGISQKTTLPTALSNPATQVMMVGGALVASSAHASSQSPGHAMWGGTLHGTII